MDYLMVFMAKEEKMPTIRLTPGDDVRSLSNLLDTTVLALAGADQVTIDGNRNQLRGDQGDDVLTATANDSGAEGEAVRAQSTIFDGAGNDQLHIDANAFGQEAKVEAIARGVGKEGDDSILADSNAVVQAFGGPFPPGGAFATSTATGGIGNDNIRGSAFAEDQGEDIAIARFTGDGGAGNDTIVGSAEARSNEAIQHSLAEARGGADADTINLTSIVRGSANFEMDAKAIAQGDAGDDNITLHAEVAYDNIFGTTIDAIVEGRGGVGNDVIRATAKITGADNEGRASIVLRGDQGNDVLVANVEGPKESDQPPSNAKLFGGAGDDQLIVHGGANNLLSMKEGNDFAILDASALRFDNAQVVGGPGIDTLRLTGSTNLNINEVKVSGVEVIDMHGEGKTLALSDVLDVSDNNVLTVLGDDSNTVELRGALADAPQQAVTVDGQEFTQVTADNGAVALIQQIVDITTAPEAAS
jgi:hypothetical protein